uniref:GATA zinc finger domain-containing protein 1 n=1 Tax=Clastoptera arizonana TaxID=38151 RepID=A0A1B6D1I1_9HEMI
MPLGSKVECNKCSINYSILWHVDEDKRPLCNNCNDQVLAQKPSIEEDSKINSVSEKTKSSLRKSTRATRSYKTRLNPNAVPKPSTQKGRGRRWILKKTPIKHTESEIRNHTSNSVFHNGFHFTVGDIVAIQDVEGGFYYAQIRGFLTDQYCEKSACVTWLLPTTATDLSLGFDPSTFIYGPVEDIPRKLDCMQFVMRAPNDYFRTINYRDPSSMPLYPGNGHFYAKLKSDI